MASLITYLRTATEIKSLLALGFEKVIDLLRKEKLKVRLPVFMRYFFIERKSDKKHLKNIEKNILEWQSQRDREKLSSAVLLYHHTGSKALHGFRYELVVYKKKVREDYIRERKEFSSLVRKQWLKKIATENYLELKDAGMTESQISALKNHGQIPYGYHVHHRVPLDDSGTNDYSNLILIKDNIEHRTIHGFYNIGELQIKLLKVEEQIEIALPMPPADAVIYPNKAKGYYSDSVPNGFLVELYNVD